MLSELYIYSGILSFFLTWFAIFYVLHKIPRELDRSISHHAAKETKIYIQFAVITSVSLFLMVLYAIYFLVPTLHLHMITASLLIIAIIMELFTTWIPLTEDRKFHPHEVLSYGTALLMPFIVIGVISSPYLKGVALIMAYVGLIAIAALMVVFFVIPRARKAYLIYQSIYIVAFQLTIILVPFLN